MQRLTYLGPNKHGYLIAPIQTQEQAKKAVRWMKQHPNAGYIPAGAGHPTIMPPGPAVPALLAPSQPPMLPAPPRPATAPPSRPPFGPAKPPVPNFPNKPIVVPTSGMAPRPPNAYPMLPAPPSAEESDAKKKWKKYLRRIQKDKIKQDIKMKLAAMDAKEAHRIASNQRKPQTSPQFDNMSYKMTLGPMPQDPRAGFHTTSPLFTPRYDLAEFKNKVDFPTPPQQSPPIPEPSRPEKIRPPRRQSSAIQDRIAMFDKPGVPSFLNR